jgi:hypothetical protein
MNNTLKIMLAVLSVAAATLACKALAPSAPDAGNSVPLFQDDFSNSDSGWEPDSTPDYTIDYADGGLRIKNWTGDTIAWSNLGEQVYENIHLEVTVKDDIRDDGYGFGFICNQQGKQNDFYYLLISGSGEYVIGRAKSGSVTHLIGDGQNWPVTDLFTKHAPSYRLGADCGHGALTLYSDGKKIDSVEDTTYTEGRIGLVLWSGEGASGAGPILFDDFVMTALR